MEETVIEPEKPATDKKDDGSVYVDCIRLVEGGQIRRFETLVTKFDLVEYELSHDLSKPILFHAIEHNDDAFVKILLEMEVPLNRSYSIMVPAASVPNAPLISKVFTPYEYACHLRYYDIADMIRQRSRYLPFQQRFIRVLHANDVRRCDTFLQSLRNEKRQEYLAKQGIFFSAQLGSVRLLDYFLTKWKIDVNLQQPLNEQFSTTPLLTAITHNQTEAAKFLLFRHADPSVKGQFDNALVTALHFQAGNDLIRLLLDKHVDITARHPDYKKLSLREYCIATNRVKEKLELDAYIIRLINEGNYKRLKWLVDHGYKHINVYISHRRYGRNLAKERYQEKIVKLIDDLDVAQKRAKQKMNY